MIRSVPTTVSVVSALALALAAGMAHANNTETQSPDVAATVADTTSILGQHQAKKRAIDEKITVVGTAEQQIKQSLGVSFITAEDLARRPPANDLADIIRKMPGVNLTGNSASGQYGNNRQIDLRGMGPENTLILIDGKPVSSRNSVRMGRSGERNSRGDTNWVPVDAVESIEILRGPAAARYGSGASGGVVNIITKAPSKELHGSVSLFTSQPEESLEGASERAGFNLSGGLSDELSFRLYGNIAKTDADDPRLNGDFATTETAMAPAGREGVRNKDVNGLVRWDASKHQVLEVEAGYSRQGNIYAGDRAVNTNGSDLMNELANNGIETNVMYRQSASIAHRGSWDWGDTNLSFSYENSRNYRMNEGLAGGGEGSITSDTEWSTSTYETYELAGSASIPFKLWNMAHNGTVGFEVGQDKLDDPHSVSQGTMGGAIDGLSDERDGKSDSKYQALYAEDNIELTQAWMFTAGLRMDHYDKFGSNFSPYVSTSYELTQDLTLRLGIAKAFKAPNLYQSNPDYLYYTRGNGCPNQFPSQGAGCYILGNDDLDQETSVNKEVGLQYQHDGWNASVTYFRNDYDGKIVSGLVPYGENDNGAYLLQWVNADKAIVEGVEGNLKVPLLGEYGEVLSWNTNVTYMDKNRNETTGQPLSVIPRYTINSMVDWQVIDDLSLSFTWTRYGTQKPQTMTLTGADAAGDSLREREPYSLLSLGGVYHLNDSLRFSIGVTNLTDRRLYRESTNSTQGANTYNEPGRAYYAQATYSF
ncbi:FepA family TonB-dependent siderophore receptor [Shewanella sp. C32]|uniref:FepA family TonB-dependent siderophore receptor n=1 Tax=Shewanella electrica TaxID=515560 RepID=A0ABT2FIJ9_9GAMM|nr:FepA family TonB-dependent siderophore receptor [Shewanella electrica]MCH1924255.1 FepA family TonB-dependent siderophore receptor [Shewanella electrica]MCS4556158.1 FepA family TonB-dependent siderophore receptor [Shewanella electrica]